MVAREAQCLSRAQPHSKAFTFTLSAQNRDARGTYRLTLPEDDLKHSVSLEVVGFETQAVEQNISAEENKVVWTEGLRISTGEAPTVFGGSVPVFDHEICLRETLADGVTHYYFKVGLCPHLNEVSTQLWDADAESRAATVVSGSDPVLLVAPDNTAKYFFSTTRNKGSDATAWAAPHYMEALQELAASGQLPDVRAYAACMAQVRHIDLTTSGEPFVFTAPAATLSDADKDAGAPPTYGGTQFRVASDAKARAYLANVTAASGGAAGTEQVSTSAVAHGFLCCSPWHFPDIVRMLNHQLLTVTDSTTSGTGGTAARTRYNRCGTTGRRPANTYEFQYTQGRFRLVCREKVLDFVVLENDGSSSSSSNSGGGGGVAGYRDVFHANATTYNSAAAAVATRAVLSTAPSGSAPRCTSLWRALGFRSARPQTLVQETTRGGGVALSVVTETFYGLRAEHEPACVLETALQPAYYTPQTFADALSSALNGGRPKAAPSSPMQFVSACVFNDSLGLAHALLLPAACSRTPHQLAAGLEFLLNRTDTRGAFYSGTRHSYDEAYGRWVPLGRSDGMAASSSGISKAGTRLWYTCTYDAATGKFAITNRELDTASADGGSLNLSNPAGPPSTLFPSTVGGAALSFSSGTATSGGVRARFSLSFRSSDLAAAPAAQLSTNGLSATAVFAALFGFDAERVYEGTSLSSIRASSCFASHAQTLTRGQLNDASTADDALCLRPLDDALESGKLAHNAVDYRGSGPDDRVGPRFCYTLAGSAQNDKQLTVHAAHPATPVSTSNSAVKSGNEGGTPGAQAYNNNFAVVTASVTHKIITSLAVATAGTDHRAGDVLAVVHASNAPNEAFFRVATTSAGGAIASVALLFGGSGTSDPGAYANATDYSAYQLNASQDLRVMGGTPCTYTNAITSSTTGDASRILVQSAAVREALPVSSSVNGADWRSFQQALPFVPGDFVLLGLQQSVLLGDTNHGCLGGSTGGSHYMTVTQVSAEGHLLAATATKASDAAAICVGHHFIVQQGTCKTVIRVLTVDVSGTSYTFAVVQRGTGHEIVANKKVWLFGPIVPYIVGLVEEVGQTCLRRRTEVQSEPEAEFTSQWASLYTDPGGSGATVTTVTSLARDGSVLKIRLPLLAQYRQYREAYRYCHPSNLMRVSSLELPRFQLLNAGPSVTRDYGRDDTAWPSAGLVGDSEVGAGTVKLPHEWDLDASAGILVALADPDLVERNNVFAGPSGIVNNVVAQVPFGARVARAWSSVHAKRFSLGPKHLRTVGLQLLDYKGNTYDLRGRSCRITLNVHYL
jgi:hypothetical protein